MANIINDVSTYDQTYGKREDLSSAARVAALREYDAPLYALLPREKAIARNISWTEDAANTLAATLGAAIPSTATTFVVDNYDRFMPGDVCKMDDELIWLSSRSTSTFTCTRGFAGTTATAHASAAVITIVQRGSLEGANHSALATLKTIVTNQCQIIQQAVHVTRTMRVVANTEGDEWKYQIAKNLGEWSRMAEISILHGNINVPTTNATPRMMDGIVNFLSSEVTSTATSVSTKNFNTFIRGIWDNGGRPDILVVDSLFLSMIHEWNVGKLALESVVLPSLAGTIGGVMATRWYSPFGVFTLLPDQHLGHSMGTGGAAYTGNALALTSSEVRLRMLDPVAFYLYGKAGDYDKGMIVGEFTVQLENEDHHGIRCQATNSA